MGVRCAIENGETLHVISLFTNEGAIILQGVNATFSGGTITNYSGTIEGLGRVTNEVFNVGSIRAEGGRLTLSAPNNSNNAGGRIEAPAGGAVFSRKAWRRVLATSPGRWHAGQQ